MQQDLNGKFPSIELMPYRNWYSTKNSYFEQVVFLKHDFSKKVRDQIVEFLEIICAAFPSTHTKQNELRAELRQYFRSWKLWLMHKHKYVFYEDLLDQKKPDEFAISSENIKRLVSRLPTQIETKAARKPTAEKSDELQEIFEISNIRYDDAIVNIDLSKFLENEDNDAKQLAGLCMWANYYICTSNIDTALIILRKVCNQVKNDRSNQSNLSLYVHSWACHLKGNAELIIGNSTVAVERYSESLDHKRSIKIPLIHTIQSQIRLALAYAHMDVTKAFELLVDIENKLDQSTIKSLLLSQSPRHYHNVRADLALALGQRHFLNKNIEAAQTAWKKSYYSAVETESRVRQLAAQIHLGSVNEKNASHKIESLISSAQADREAFANKILLNYLQKYHQETISLIKLRNWDFGTFLDQQVKTQQRG